MVDMRSVIAGAIALAVTALPYTFAPGTPARSAEVNANFTALDAGLATVSGDVAALQAQVAAPTGGTPPKVLTADTDIEQLETGPSPLAAGAFCSGSMCVYRLTAGPFVLTNAEQRINGTPCILCADPSTCPCPEQIGRISYFPAPDDPTAAAIADRNAQPRWRWDSIAYESDVQQSGAVLRLAVRRGEYLYSFHTPASPSPVAGQEPNSVFVSSSGYWSGYHPY
jgi:hypothetical protein